jgi:glucan phosphoethanolaminetransferase (alkaline phosphatase superfamily)
MITDLQRAHRRDWWLAVGMALLVTVCDAWMLATPIAPYFTVNGTAPGLLVLARRSAGVLGLLASQAAFFWASYSSPAPIRLAALGLYAAVTFLEYGFVAGAGGVMNARDIDMAFQSVKYWPSMIRAFVDWRALAPVALYAVTAGLRRPTSPAWRRRWAMAAVAGLLVHGAYGAAYLKRSVEFGDAEMTGPPMAAFQSFFRTLVLFGCDSATEALQPYRRRLIDYRASTMPKRHVILVIDESVSSAHLSLDGYTRPTTPWLDDLKRQGRLATWGGAAAASTYSNSSVSSLLTGFNAFPDLEHRVFTLPTVFQFGRAMNYGTHLFDGQLTVRRFGLSPSDMRFVGDWRNASSFGDDPDTDMRMARAAAGVLKEPAGQLIVIIKRGNHEPQENNYPSGGGMWQPSRDVPRSEEPVARANAYDNAIRYNLDAFFRALLQPDGGLPRTVGIYTSDHGEMLAEHGGTPFVRKLVPEVATVPLVMFGDDRPRVDTGYRASHHNIFATILDLMDVPAAIRPWSYGRSLIGARATDHDPRPVLSGYMFGRDYFYEIKDFDTLGRTGQVSPDASP